MAIEMGRLKVATLPAPSADPTEPAPAIVDTEAPVVMRRMRLLVESETNSIPSAARARPRGSFKLRGLARAISVAGRRAGEGADETVGVYIADAVVAKIGDKK